MKLIAALPYHSGDHLAATRLLEWIRDLDHKVDHHLLLVADNAVPIDTKKSINALGRTIFSSVETIMPRCPSAVNGNYHVPAAQMFMRTMGHVSKCHKWPFLWMEPDCVPLKPGWLDSLAFAYDQCPHRFLGSIMESKQDGIPAKMFFGTAIYPSNCYEELKGFCDGKNAWDVAFSDYLVPMSENTPLIQHVFGAAGDPPRFKPVKEPTDGKNVGTLANIRSEAVLFHRNKDGSLIDLIRNKSIPNPDYVSVPPEPLPEPSLLLNQPIRRGPGRPPKQQPESVGMQ